MNIMFGFEETLGLAAPGSGREDTAGKKNGPDCRQGGRADERKRGFLVMKATGKGGENDWEFQQRGNRTPRFWRQVSLAG